MSAAEFALQKAAYAALEAALPSDLPVFDMVPADDNVARPFAAFADTTSERAQVGRCDRGWTVRFRIMIFTDVTSRQEVWNRVELIREVLEGASPALDAPFVVTDPIREYRAGSMTQRMAKVNAAFIDFSAVVSRPL